MNREEAGRINHLCGALQNCAYDLRVSAKTKVSQAPTAMDVAKVIDLVNKELSILTKEPAHVGTEV